MWTRLEAQADSIKFSITETKALLSAWENESKYVTLIDSCEAEIKLREEDLRDAQFKVKACEKVQSSNILLIGKQDEENKDLRKRLKISERLTKFWKTMTGVAMVGGVGYSVYKEVKN